MPAPSELIDARADTDNGFGSPRQIAAAAATQIASARAAQEVQAAMVVAKQYPRDETAAFARVMKACQRKALAEAAAYAYPRGDQVVTGPSIRLAEVLAQSWGNIDFGIVELEQKFGESQVMAYAWDLETNTRQTKVFSVKHERHTKRGKQHLSDPRDIYEMVANQGARRMRACILGVIPGDVVDAAVTECEKTMANTQGGEPLSDRVRKMVAAFQQFGVSQQQIEGRLKHKIETTSEAELSALRKVYLAIKDGMADIHSYFEVPPTESQTRTQQIEEELLKARGGQPSQDAQPAEEQQQTHQPSRGAVAMEAIYKMIEELDPADPQAKAKSAALLDQVSGLKKLNVNDDDIKRVRIALNEKTTEILGLAEKPAEQKPPVQQGGQPPWIKGDGGLADDIEGIEARIGAAKSNRQLDAIRSAIKNTILPRDAEAAAKLTAAVEEKSKVIG